MLWSVALGAGRSLSAFLYKNRKYWWVILIVAIAVQAKQNHSLKNQVKNLKGGALQLEKDDLAKVHLGGSTVDTAARNPDGSVRRASDFRAPEANTDVRVRIDPVVQAKLDELNQKLARAKNSETKDQGEIDRLQAEREALLRKLVKVDVNVQKAGFVFKPGIGFLYGGDLYPEFDIKLFFLSRYSLKVGLGFNAAFTPALASAGLTRHVDDLLPAPFNFRNVELQLSGGFRFTEQDFLALVGLRINL